MTGYLDKDGEKLRKGFYYYEKPINIYYFTGRYAEDLGLPIFEQMSRPSKDSILLESYLTKRLSKFDKREIKKRITTLKKDISWLEKKLKD